MTDDDLKRMLARLPEPDPPAGFDTAVMSAIAAEPPVGTVVSTAARAAASPRAAGGASAGAFAIGLAGAGLAAGAMVLRGWTEATASLVARLDPTLLRLPPADSPSFLTSLGLLLLLAAMLMPLPAKRGG